MRIAQLGQDTLLHTAVDFHRNVTDIQVIRKTEVMVYSSFCCSILLCVFYLVESVAIDVPNQGRHLEKVTRDRAQERAVRLGGRYEGWS